MSCVKKIFSSGVLTLLQTLEIKHLYGIEFCQPNSLHHFLSYLHLIVGNDILITCEK